MTYWITRIADAENKAKTASGLIANQNAAKAAGEIGFKALHYPRLYAKILQEESKAERRDRLEALCAGVKEGDVVIVQYPMWTNYSSFEREFFDYLKGVKKAKTAALVWDIISWVHDDRERDYSKDPSIWMLNLFDVVIAANPKIAKRLRSEGKVNKAILSMDLSDLLYQGHLQEKKFEKKLYYVATGINPNMVEEYQAKTPICMIGPDWEVKEHPEQMTLLGGKQTDEIPPIFDGGFGLVGYAQGGRYKGMFKYGDYNNPLKLSLYLASGLPPVLMSSSAHADWVRERGVGLVINSWEEIDEALDKVTPEAYQQMLENIKPWQRAVSTGFFTKRAVMEAVRYLKFGMTDSLIELEIEDIK